MPFVLPHWQLGVYISRKLSHKEYIIDEYNGNVELSMFDVVSVDVNKLCLQLYFEILT